jgi:hypothetical protein
MGKLKDSTIPDFDQHSHDPLCPWSGSTEWDLLIGCHDCNLISKVRDDQTQRCIAAVDDYFDRGEYSPAQLMDDLYALLSSDSALEPASEDK